jgi:hypothetical protein
VRGGVPGLKKKTGMDLIGLAGVPPLDQMTKDIV